MPQPTPSPEPTEAAEVAEVAETISVLGLEDTDQGRGERLSLRRPAEWRAARTEIPAEELRSRLGEFAATMRDMIASLPQEAGQFQLNEVSFTAEVSAKGTVSLLGSGGELAGRAGITFTFTRS
ncbi:hypothetical protein HUT18_21990 [Streptomyces sp. NA04227]|uniref:Pepco domain-containing protein n=1 Tax=Streptomyces sp. NA04227 TaxID=2742136 RepID=UPI00159172DA|nr:hypothetical protein [Streptomyces sp. NA04227]QKW08648.1 hypothetical protein HUT18_21990 [Streptomyces sp. NA04227]